MLKILRVGLSVVFFSLITFYFIDFGEILPHQFHVVEHFQFVPAYLAMNVLGMALIVIITLLIGRIYCSSLCPMGVLQDIIAFVSKKATKKKKRYKYSKPKTILRWSVLGIILVTFFLGFNVLLSFFDPYSAYGRLAVHLFKPVYMAGNNFLATVLTHAGNYSLYAVHIFIMSAFSFSVTVVTLLGIGFLAWKYGRTFCNTLCPVGTILGFLSKYSLYKVRIDAGKCNSCAACATRCKASCIDSKARKIDYSRCVDCFNCVKIKCKQDAMSFSFLSIKKQPAIEKVDLSKRRFFVSGLTTALTLPALMADSAGHSGHPLKRQTPVSPPGSQSAEQLLNHCTSCHLCISKCPSHALKPAFMEYGLGGMMLPMLDFRHGFCNYDCTVCSEICPNGALLPLTVDEKHKTQMGYVVFNEDTCIVITEGTNCGACSEHCPTQAVKMMPFHDGLTLPKVDTEICIGCGGCESICPVHPHAAIYVEGNAVHQEAKVIIDENITDEVPDSFGF
ncbi:MAG: 4Fe-4S dicluster domain-containing protein [Bacteroidales bacterium]|nr:4Fe-4S dicluster domain-containing protein [Bacteroidales bacterium]